MRDFIHNKRMYFGDEGLEGYPAKRLKRAEKPKPCVECQINLADPPSELCPGCQSYKEY